MKDGNVSSVRANFLIAFEQAFGRGKTIVTRRELLDFCASWAPDQKGGTGLILRFPSWLTNPKDNPYKINRGTFRVPWDTLDEYNALMNSAATTNTSTVANVPDVPVTVSEPASNNIEVPAP